MPMNQALLAEFDNEMRTTRRVLERISTETFGWKPHEKSNNMAWLAWHVGTIPIWATVTLNTEVLDFATPDPNMKFPEQPKTNEELMKTFDKAVTDARAAIAAASDEALMKPWTLKNGPQTVFTAPKVAVLRGFVMNHLIHHRGQLSVYMRLKDIPVPSIYGPSADENPWAEKAAGK